MKRVKIELKGVTPLLMHRFPMENIEGFEKKTKEEQAEIFAYRIPKTEELYVPGICIQRALVGGATFCKGKGRGSLQKQAAAAMTVEEEYLGLGRKEYEIDSRAVVNPATKGRVVRHRPKIADWKIKFTLLYDEMLLSEKNVREIVENACSRVGFLDFRPEKKGPFGRAMISKWD